MIARPVRGNMPSRKQQHRRLNLIVTSVEDVETSDCPFQVYSPAPDRLEEIILGDFWENIFTILSAKIR